MSSPKAEVAQSLDENYVITGPRRPLLGRRGGVPFGPTACGGGRWYVDAPTHRATTADARPDADHRHLRRLPARPALAVGSRGGGGRRRVGHAARHRPGARGPPSERPRPDPVLA